MSKIIKSSVNAQIKKKFFLPFSYSAEQLWLHHCRAYFDILWYLVLTFIVNLDKKKFYYKLYKTIWSMYRRFTWNRELRNVVSALGKRFI